jgi:hypothetical protein
MQAVPIDAPGKELPLPPAASFEGASSFPPEHVDDSSNDEKGADRIAAVPLSELYPTLPTESLRCIEGSVSFILSSDAPRSVLDTIARTCDTNEKISQAAAEISEADLVSCTLTAIRMSGDGESRATLTSPCSDLEELQMLSVTTVQHLLSPAWASREGTNNCGHCSSNNDTYSKRRGFFKTKTKLAAKMNAACFTAVCGIVKFCSGTGHPRDQCGM